MTLVADHALEYLSHSRLESYRSCSLKFRFHYIEKIPATFTPAPLAFGIAFHRAIEEALVGLLAGEFPPVDELVRVFSVAFDEEATKAPIRYGEKEGRDSMLEQARRMLDAWTAWSRPSVKILAIEHQFSVPLAEWLPPLVGRIDLIELDECNGYINVIDVKSSRGRWSQEDVLQHASQLALYWAGVQDLVRDLGKPVRVGFEIVTKTKTPVVERYYLVDGGETLDRQIKAATMVLEAVERGIYMPSPSWMCATCPWAGPCREW